MSTDTYYEELKDLARRKRAKTPAFGLREARLIYKEEGIKIDHWRLSRKLKAIYMCTDDDFSVALQKSLPEEPKLFALIHELKHHYRDRDALNAGIISCGDYNQNALIEKGAEVFAAEFIYPEDEFAGDLKTLGLSRWHAEDVVQFKRICKAKVSYTFICKRLERLGVIAPRQFNDVRFKKLEESIYGVPFYRRRRAASQNFYR